MTVTTKLSPRAALYGRFSSSRQNPTSAQDQLRLCEERAMTNGWRVTQRFTDEAVTGKDDKRPGFLALQQLVKQGEVDVIVAESLSRLSRRQSTIAGFFEDCLYHQIKLHTLQEGEITTMHIGLLGVMNSLYLESLADGTHRGQSAAIIEGKSAGGRSYGYRVPLHANGQPKTGELEIVPEEAAVIQRIFSEYARGLSPRTTTEALNTEGVAAPRGKDHGNSKGDGTWRMNTIYGNRQRGTGILNNELYIGRRVWNKLKYITRPGSSTRESRLNPESEWKVVEVPHLRIISDELWQAVKARQASLDALRDASQKDGKGTLSGNRATRRPTYLLSGLVRCGKCGGSMNIAGSQPKRYFCANAREKGKCICQGIPGIAQHKLEAVVLNGLRHHLMQPGAVADFIERYQIHQREMDAARHQTMARLRSSLAQTEKEIANIMTAIKAGIFTSSTKAELEGLEARKDKLAHDLHTAQQAAPAIPDDLAEVYAKQVEALVTSLNAPETRSEAIDAIRALVDKVIVHWDAAAGGHAVEIEGDIVALLRAGTNKNAAAVEAAASSFEMVAGAGFEPATFRL